MDSSRQFRRTVIQVDEEIAFMRHDHDVAQEIRALLVHPDQGLLRMGHFFFNRVWSWYLHSTMTGIRAQIRHNRRPQRSVGGILRKIPGYAARDASWFAMLPNQGRPEELVARLETEARPACAVVDQRIAHRDLDGYPPDVIFDQLTPVIGLIDGVMDEVWQWVFGKQRERAIVDVDPYWARLLFAKSWLPPTSFDERVALSRDAELTTESGRRDFTPTAVYLQRPTDEWLREQGVTREEWDAFRADSS